MNCTAELTHFAQMYLEAEAFVTWGVWFGVLVMGFLGYYLADLVRHVSRNIAMFQVMHRDHLVQCGRTGKRPYDGSRFYLVKTFLAYLVKP